MYVQTYIYIYIYIYTYRIYDYVMLCSVAAPTTRPRQIGLMVLNQYGQHICACNM